MNKWKFAFWCCFVLLLLVTSVSIYTTIDQGVTISYMREGYSDTENDLENIAKIINETDFSKAEIERSPEKQGDAVLDQKSTKDLFFY